MFASTSRTVLGSLRAAPVTASRALSTSAPRLGLRSAQPMVVELNQDVPGLGRKFDRVQVKRGRVISELLPRRLIRLLPWKKAATRPRAYIRPFDGARPSDHMQIEAPEATPAAILAETLAKLDGVPKLITFKRRTIQPDGKAIHGSLTLNNVLEYLAAEHSLTATEVGFAWVNKLHLDRIKELGAFRGKIIVKGAENKEKVVMIKLVREE